MVIKQIKRIYLFLRYNSNRRLSIEVLFLSAFYRLCILTIPARNLQKFMGVLNEESAQEEPEERYRDASKVSHAVNRVCGQTPWESKCLVRALTAQHLLRKQKIPSTLYLGVGKKGDAMIAHAWLRSGRYYLTGGCGDGYSLVAKFHS